MIILFLIFQHFPAGSDSPSSSTPEEGDTEDDGQAVSVFITSKCFRVSGSSLSLCEIYFAPRSL